MTAVSNVRPFVQYRNFSPFCEIFCFSFALILEKNDVKEEGMAFCSIYNPGQNIWNKIEKPSKTGQDKKMLDIYFCVFF